MGVMNRANQKLGGGDYITGPQKDDLIRYRTPLAIVDVNYDANGSSQYPGARWLLSVEPWDNKFPGPTGVLSFKNNPSRQGQFEDIQDQLEEVKARGETYIGPVAMVSIPNKKGGNAIKTLADVLCDENGEILTDARGFPKIDGEVETPPPAPAPTPASTPNGPRRPTGQAAAAPAAAPAPAATPQPPSAPAATTPAPARRGRRAATQPTPPAPGQPPESVQYERQSQSEAAAEPVGPHPDIKEATQPIPMATAVCPHCKTEIGPNRVFPAQGGGYVIMHANCPITQQTEILPILLEAQ